MTLEEIQTDATIRGILPDANVTVVRVEWHGSDALTLVYRDPAGRVDDEILYRHDESRIELVEAGRPWSFDGDGAREPYWTRTIPTRVGRTQQVHR